MLDALVQRRRHLDCGGRKSIGTDFSLTFITEAIVHWVNSSAHNPGECVSIRMDFGGAFVFARRRMEPLVATPGPAIGLYRALHKSCVA